MQILRFKESICFFLKNAKQKVLPFCRCAMLSNPPRSSDILVFSINHIMAWKYNTAKQWDHVFLESFRKQGRGRLGQSSHMILKQQTPFPSVGHTWLRSDTIRDQKIGSSFYFCCKWIFELNSVLRRPDVYRRILMDNEFIFSYFLLSNIYI